MYCTKWFISIYCAHKHNSHKSNLQYPWVNPWKKWLNGQDYVRCLAEMWILIPGRSPLLRKVLQQEQWKVGGSRLTWSRCCVPQQCWCLVRSPECLKEWDLMRGVLATQTSPTLTDAQICSQTVIHCYLSRAYSYQSPSIPSSYSNIHHN